MGPRTAEFSPQELLNAYQEIQRHAQAGNPMAQQTLPRIQQLLAERGLAGHGHSPVAQMPASPIPPVAGAPPPQMPSPPPQQPIGMNAAMPPGVGVYPQPPMFQGGGGTPTPPPPIGMNEAMPPGVGVYPPAPPSGPGMPPPSMPPDPMAMQFQTGVMAGGMPPPLLPSAPGGAPADPLTPFPPQAFYDQGIAGSMAALERPSPTADAGAPMQPPMQPPMPDSAGPPPMGQPPGIEVPPVPPELLNALSPQQAPPPDPVAEESDWGSELARFGMNMLTSQHTSLLGAASDAGLKWLDRSDKKKASKAQAARQKKLDDLEERKFKLQRGEALDDAILRRKNIELRWYEITQDAETNRLLREIEKDNDKEDDWMKRANLSLQAMGRLMDLRESEASQIEAVLLDPTITTEAEEQARIGAIRDDIRAQARALKQLMNFGPPQGGGASRGGVGAGAPGPVASAAPGGGSMTASNTMTMPDGRRLMQVNGKWYQAPPGVS